MKKSLLILCAAALALVSCNKDLTPNATKQGEPVDVVFNLSATHPDGGGTKAVKDAWEAGDVVFVFFSEQTAPAYLELKYDGSKWENNQKDLSFTAGETGTMTAVYLPFGSDATVSADGGAYKFSKTYYSYYLTGQLAYTVTDGEISGTFAMEIPEGYVQFFEYVPSSYFNQPIELREPHLTPQGIASIAADGTIQATNVAHGAPLPGYVYKKGTDDADWGFVFSGILAEEARNVETDYLFTIVYGGWEGMYFKHAFSGKKFYRGEQEGRALRLPDGGWEEITDYKPIDLGIDVDGKRIYWSSNNLGAKNPEEFGDYFAWGEISGYVKGKTDFSWKSYKWMQPDKEDWHFITKYTAPDGQEDGIWYDGDTFKGDIKEDEAMEAFKKYDYIDDAARAQLGKGWRTPTKEECEKLYDNCSRSWIADYKGTSVPGEVFTGPNGNSIFIPAAGLYADSANSYENVLGSIWSSSLDKNQNCYAWCMYFSDQRVDWAEQDRCYGLSVRPVCD